MNGKHWDVSSIFAEAKALNDRAASKVRERKGVVVWLKKLAKKFSTTEKEGLFSAFIPKVQTIQSEIEGWIAAIDQRRVMARKDGESVIHDLEVLIAKRESTIHFFDEALNEYRKVLFLLTSKTMELRVVISFNEEVLNVARNPRRRRKSSTAEQYHYSHTPLSNSNTNPPIPSDCYLNKAKPPSSSSSSFASSCASVVEAAPSSWLGFQTLDNQKVSSSGFKQAMRNYVPHSIYSASPRLGRSSSSSQSEPNSSPLKKEGAPRPTGSTRGPSCSFSRSACEAMKEASKLEAERDEERRSLPGMSEDREHQSLFEQLFQFKAVILIFVGLFSVFGFIFALM